MTFYTGEYWRILPYFFLKVDSFSYEFRLNVCNKIYLYIHSLSFYLMLQRSEFEITFIFHEYYIRIVFLLYVKCFCIRFSFFSKSLFSSSLGVYPDRSNIANEYEKKFQNISEFSPTVGL